MRYDYKIRVVSVKAKLNALGRLTKSVPLLPQKYSSVRHW